MISMSHQTEGIRCELHKAAQKVDKKTGREPSADEEFWRYSPGHPSWETTAVAWIEGKTFQIIKIAIKIYTGFTVAAWQPFL